MNLQRCSIRAMTDIADSEFPIPEDPTILSFEVTRVLSPLFL